MIIGLGDETINGGIIAYPHGVPDEQESADVLKTWAYVSQQDAIRHVLDGRMGGLLSQRENSVGPSNFLLALL